MSTLPVVTENTAPLTDQAPSRPRLYPFETTTEHLAAHLAGSFEVVTHPAQEEQLRFLDTHLWTLWNAGLQLVQTRSMLLLQRCEEGWPTPDKAFVCLPWKKQSPRQLNLLPPSPLRRALEKEAKHRALHETAKLTTTLHHWDLRDSLQKIIARLLIRALPKQKRLFVEVIPLRGYESEGEKAHQLLATMTGLATDARHWLEEAFSAAGATPIRYTLKPEFTLEPQMEARRVIADVAMRTLAIARRNEEGILHDWDSEFLHDYRVCLRRIRSVLGSIKEIFPEAILAQWKETLGAISRQTNRVRDLDVYLLSREEMTALLPPPLQGGLERFFADVAKERRAAFRQLKHYLESPDYLQAIRLLEEGFAHPEELPHTARSASPILEEAQERIARRRRQLLRGASRIGKQSPDEAFHQIRILGKKLRYLLEFFGSLLPQDEIGDLNARLGKLQGKLGRFNDTSVQQHYLLDYAQQQLLRRPEPQAALSLGGLIAVQYQEHERLKDEMRKALRSFARVTEPSP